VIVEVGEYSISPLAIDVSRDVTLSNLSKVYDGNATIADLEVTLSSSPVKSGDVVTFTGAGMFDSRHVGVNKAVTINLALTGADANNYSLSNNGISGNIGTITQATSATWTGNAGNGLWSTAANWLNNVLPDQSNVATAIIPIGAEVNYNFDTVGTIGSAIRNNGQVTISSADSVTLSNTLSGAGTWIYSADAAGDTLTLGGTNTISGSVNIQNHSILLNANNALGLATLRGNGGNLSVSSGVTLNQLTTVGTMNVLTDINATGTLNFANIVILGGNGSSSSLNPLELNTTNSDIIFNGTVTAGANSKANYRSLTVDAGDGSVIFNERVGYEFNGINYFELNDTNIYSLAVTAAEIQIKADIMTFEEQIYNGSVFIGNNGNNGFVRTLLSVDPKVEINGTVDDLDPNTIHTLITKAIALNRFDVPIINITGEVGGTNPLVEWIAQTGRQNESGVWSDILPNTTGRLLYKLNEILGGSQILQKINMSGYVAPQSNSSIQQLAGELQSFYRSIFRDFVKNYLQNFINSTAKPSVAVGAKIIDNNYKENTFSKPELTPSPSNSDNVNESCDISIESECNQ